MPRAVVGGFDVRRWRLAALAALCLTLAACGNPTAPTPPGGTYSSAAYGFTVSYPNGWKANALTAPTSAPLILVITKTTSGSTPSAQVSTFTLDVLRLADKTLATAAAKLHTNKTLTHITLAGQPAFRDTPIAQNSQGSSLVVTHTDYYVVHGAYEYQMSTDAVPGDATALQGIVNSFTLSAA